MSRSNRSMAAEESSRWANRQGKALAITTMLDIRKAELNTVVKLQASFMVTQTSFFGYFHNLHRAITHIGSFTGSWQRLVGESTIQAIECPETRENQGCLWEVAYVVQELCPLQLP